MNIPRLLALAIAIGAISTGGNAQTICIYTMMTQAHAMVDHCGEPLNPVAEKSYYKSTQALAALMIANTPSLKDHADSQAWNSKYQKGLHDKIVSKDQSMCRKNDYQFLRKYLVKMIEPEGEAVIKKILTAPKYPGDNACM